MTPGIKYFNVSFLLAGALLASSAHAIIITAKVKAQCVVRDKVALTANVVPTGTSWQLNPVVYKFVPTQPAGVTITFSSPAGPDFAVPAGRYNVYVQGIAPPGISTPASSPAYPLTIPAFVVLQNRCHLTGGTVPPLNSHSSGKPAS